jgi:hypothetical protein
MKRRRLSQATAPGQRGRIVTLFAAPLLMAQGVAGPTMATFDPRTAPGFGDPAPALRTYLARAGAARGRPQHFCMIGYGDAASGHVEVHWIEGRRLIRWEGSDPDYPADLIGWGRRDYHIDRDPVRTDTEVGSSTYLVTRAWIDGILADCARRGVRLTVTRR